MDVQLEKLHRIQIEILNEIVSICEANNIQYFLSYGTLLGAVRHKGFIPWDDDLDISMPRNDYERFLRLCGKELSDSYILDCSQTNDRYWLPFAKIRKRGTIYEERAVENVDTPKGIWVDVFPLDSVKYQSSPLQSFQQFLVTVLCFNLLVKQINYIPHTFKGKLARLLLSCISVDTSFSWLDKLMRLWNNDEGATYFVCFVDGVEIKKKTIHKSKFLPSVKLEFEGILYEAPNDYHYILTQIYGDYMELPPEEQRKNHDPILIDYGS